MPATTCTGTVGARTLEIPFGPGIQAEALAFLDAQTLLVGGENGEIHRVAVSDLVPVGNP